MQTQPNFKQLMDKFVADLKREAEQAKDKLAKAVADSKDPYWDLYYDDVEAEAKAVKAYFDSRIAVQGAIL